MSTQALRQLAENPVLFAELLLNFKPFSYQQQMLADQSNRIVACMGRQTGKTTTIATKAIHYAYTHPKTTTLIISPSLRQSMIMFDKITTLTTNPILTKSITRKTRTIIQLTNKSQIIALPCSQHMLRGYTANLAICDEAAFMPEQTITEIIFPMLSTTKGKAIFLSTPWDKNHFFYKAFTNPQYKTYTVTSAENPLITKEFLQEMQQNMTQEAYKREYEAQFTETANTYFPQTLIRTCIELAQKLNLETFTNPETAPKTDYYAGLDLGKLQDHTALAIVTKQDDTTKLVHTHEFPLNTPYSHVIGHLNKLDKQLHLKQTLIDQTGIGEPILEQIHETGQNTAHGVKLTQETKETLLTTLKLLMEQQKLAIPYDPKLIQQINDQQYTYSRNGHLQFTCPPNTHDDLLWALALATAAAKTETAHKLWIIAKTAHGKTRLQQLRNRLQKHQHSGATR